MESPGVIAAGANGEKRFVAEAGFACRPAPDSTSDDQRRRGPSHLSVLGGGVAGLAAGYYARKNGLPFAVYEAAGRVGGNCITLAHGDFRFDSGAHRFHDREPAVTAEVAGLLGDALERIEAPSRCYYDGKSVDFPLSPLNLLVSLGWCRFAKAGTEVLYSRLRSQRPNQDFETFARNTYGQTIARQFLLNYSEKLWGLPCRELSPEVAGQRLKGLDLKTFVIEALRGKKAKTAHLDGAFHYPRLGIGTVAETLAQRCGLENIRLDSAITRIFHNPTRIEAVEINARHRIEVRDVVSTLPLPHFLEMMEPPPPAEILALARGLRFRDVILVALFLERASVTDAATVYFPSAEFPFTRLYEPRNRSARMSPPGRTSLVVEIPCDERDPRGGRAGEAELTETVRARLVQIGWVRKSEILDSTVARMKCAYPVLAVDTPRRIAKITAFLSRFTNLRVTGRNGRFQHAFSHDVIQSGVQAVGELISASSK
jgi:protoporphyrinogen oxidase